MIPSLNSSDANLSATTTPPPSLDSHPSQDVLEAMRALQIIGVDPKLTPAKSTCGNGECHSIDKNKLHDWIELTRITWDTCFETEANWGREIRRDKEEMKCLERRKSFIGFFAAGLHTTNIKNRFKRAFGFGFDYFHWTPHVKSYMMPEFESTGVNPNGAPNGPKKISPRKPITDSDFDTLMTWVLKGAPGLDEAWPETASSPLSNHFAQCRDFISDELVDVLKESSNANWMKNMVRYDPDFSPFGCGNPTVFKKNWSIDPFNTPIQSCFDQQNARGQVIFKEESSIGSDWHLPPNQPRPKGWAAVDATHRILNKIAGKTSNWMRSSADGRFSGNGGTGKIQPPAQCRMSASLITDHQKTLNSKPNEKHIFVDAKYDPGFFPNNKGFTWMIGSKTGLFCNQRILEEPNLNQCLSYVTNSEIFSKYCVTEKMGVYQQVGASLDGNDLVIVRGTFRNDNSGHLPINSRDPGVANILKPAAHQLEVIPFVDNNCSVSSAGRNSCKSFSFDSTQYLRAINEGDWNISPTAKLLVSRAATSNSTGGKQSGYHIRKLINLNGKYSTKHLGTVCLQGGKAAVSYNDRLIAVHHFASKTKFDQTELGFESEGNKFRNEIYPSKTGMHVEINLNPLPVTRKVSGSGLRLGQIFFKFP